MATVGSRAWAALAFVHRWLGIAGCLLFLLWFVSGIAMIYVRMPELPARERLRRAPALQLDALRIAADDARATAGSTSPSIQIAMLGSRPVYRFGGARSVTIFADTGEQLTRLAADDADALARAYASESGTARPLGMLQVADQWTLELRSHFPLHRYAIADGAGSEFYISSTTGEVVMQTTRRGRALAYIGPVAHWLYLPVLRRNGPLWTTVIVWSSSFGCLLCLTGLIAGFLRFAPFRPFLMRGQPSRSPYVGWMKWHHYAGLLFGVITLTWTFSGLLSMDPFPALSGPGVSREQREAVSGGDGPLPTQSQMREALDVVQTRLMVKELRLVWFRGEPYWIASADDRRMLVSALHPERGAFERFEPAVMEAAARAAAPAAAATLDWLNEYDGYYYDRDGGLSLPVLRAQYSDGTWLYLDPARGAIVSVFQPADRLNRWLYHGLHSLDPRWLRTRRPLWDIVVIALSVGGVVGVASSLVPAWRRVRRTVR